MLPPSNQESVRPLTAITLFVFACLACLPPLVFPFAARNTNSDPTAPTIRISLLSTTMLLGGKVVSTVSTMDIDCLGLKSWLVVGVVFTFLALVLNVSALFAWTCLKRKLTARGCVFGASFSLMIVGLCMIVAFTRSFCSVPSLNSAGFSISTAGFVCTLIGLVLLTIGGCVVHRRRVLRRQLLTSQAQLEVRHVEQSPLLASGAVTSTEVVSGVVLCPALPVQYEVACISAVNDFLQSVMDDTLDVATIVTIPPTRHLSEHRRPAGGIDTPLLRGKRCDVGSAIARIVEEVGRNSNAAVVAPDANDAQRSECFLWDGITAAIGEFFVNARPDKAWVCIIVAASPDGGSSEGIVSVSTILTGFTAHRPENQCFILNVDGVVPRAQLEKVRIASGSHVVQVQHGARYGPEATFPSALSVIAAHLILSPLASTDQIASESRRVAHRGSASVVSELIRGTYQAVRTTRSKAAERLKYAPPESQPSIDYLVVMDLSRQ